MCSQSPVSHFTLQFYGTACNSMKIQVPSYLRPFCRYYSLSSHFVTRPTTKCSPGLTRHLLGSLPWAQRSQLSGSSWCSQGHFCSSSLTVSCNCLLTYFFSSFGCELEGRAWGFAVCSLVSGTTPRTWQALDKWLQSKWKIGRPGDTSLKGLLGLWIEKRRRCLCEEEGVDLFNVAGGQNGDQ